eukprot:1866701-Pyramimonas_sp.AAC.1
MCIRDSPNMGQEAPKKALRRPQEGPKTAQEAPKTAPRGGPCGGSEQKFRALGLKRPPGGRLQEAHQRTQNRRQEDPKRPPKGLDV